MLYIFVIDYGTYLILQSFNNIVISVFYLITKKKIV